MINKKVILLSISSMLIFFGCAGNEVKVQPKKELTVQEKKYQQVTLKTISDCKEHGIELDEKKTTTFINNFPEEDIDKIVAVTKKMPKKNCQFFADEISEEKVNKVNELVSKTMNACKEFGVNLNESFLQKKASRIPLFIIKKVLATQGAASQKECQAMYDKSK